MKESFKLNRFSLWTLAAIVASALALTQNTNFSNSVLVQPADGAILDKLYKMEAQLANLANTTTMLEAELQKITKRTTEMEANTCKSLNVTYLNIPSPSTGCPGLFRAQIFKGLNTRRSREGLPPMNYSDDHLDLGEWARTLASKQKNLSHPVYMRNRAEYGQFSTGATFVESPSAPSNHINVAGFDFFAHWPGRPYMVVSNPSPSGPPIISQLMSDDEWRLTTVVGIDCAAQPVVNHFEVHTFVVGVFFKLNITLW